MADPQENVAFQNAPGVQFRTLRIPPKSLRFKTVQKTWGTADHYNNGEIHENWLKTELKCRVGMELHLGNPDLNGSRCLISFLQGAPCPTTT